MSITSRQQPLYSQLVDTIREKIDNDMKPGDLLPSERDLSVKYNLSRTTVRLALAELEALGVVEQIAKLVKSGAAHLGECAILTRTNAQQQVVCKALKVAKLPYRVRKDVGWQRNVLEDAQSYGSQGISDIFASSNISTVTVSTIHAVKGLEFAHVYVIGCSEGLIPLKKSADLCTLQ